MEISSVSIDEYISIFGSDNTSRISHDRTVELLRRAWTGSMSSMGMRGLCWRYFLGLISSQDKSAWVGELSKMITSYKDLKSKLMPSIDKVKADPLSALAENDSTNEEWNKYYKNIELITFIKGDLDRLFLSGVDDDFFQTKFHRDLLLANLFIWSSQHPEVSYRQGMHELVGIVLFVVDHEKQHFQSLIHSGQIPFKDPVFSLFNENNVEAFTFAIFNRIMLELKPLYDPLPVQGIENQPFVVNFCTKIQGRNFYVSFSFLFKLPFVLEHYLRVLDRQLCQHLEESFVQAQLYGLRWSRLLLAREFPVTHSLLFRLWDYMFASCFDAETEHLPAAAYMDDDAPPNVYSLLANVRAMNYNKNSNTGKRIAGAERVNYVCTPLLGVLGDLMLAMLIQVTSSICNCCLFLMFFAFLDSHSIIRSRFLFCHWVSDEISQW
jgi:hypothetical protein